MCGIVGILDTGADLGADRLREAVAAMNDSLAHRGPDDQGVWVDPTGVCALGQRRLAVLDLSPLGHQPMTDESGQVALTFNGEIYNFQELAADLHSQGVRLKGRSDTEVLLHLLAEQVPMHLNALRGMFALALWNGGRRQLLLARDPFGKKPLYLARGRGFLAFASELQALELLADLKLTLSTEALGEYLWTMSVLAPRTIYREVEKLAPGCYALLTPHANGIQQQRYWQFEAGTHTPGLRLADNYAGRVKQLEQLLTQAVARRLVADVPLGAFLSGGVDSSLVVALMRKLGVRPKTFSVGFADSAESEHVFARQVAEHLGTEHHELLVRPKVIELASTIAAALDEPNGDTSCLPTYLLAQHTRQFVTVALSGDGGDELFGGYNRYLHVLDEESSRPDWDPAAAYLGVRRTIFSPGQVQAFLRRLPPALMELVRRWQATLRRPGLPLLHRMRTLDVEGYLSDVVLAKVDRMCMRFALEVRCPLLDVDVARFAAALGADDCATRTGDPPRFAGKRILKDVLARYLPGDLIHRPKMGFGLPNTFWDAKSLLPFAAELLDAPDSRLHDFLDRKAVRRWLLTQQDMHWYSVYQVWSLLMLELWLRKPRLRPQRRETGWASLFSRHERVAVATASR